MITIRPSHARGTANYGWLDSRHTFSFGHYFDPAQMGFCSLRVINEDKVAPGQGFATHSHRDMEIVTYVLAGALEHKDSLGNGSIIRPGEIQRMSAGTGIAHSEYNPSSTEPVHFLQIWIQPSIQGLEPSYEQITLSAPTAAHPLRLIASQANRQDTITLHQDINVYAGHLPVGQPVSHSIATGRAIWLQMVRGAAQLDNHALAAGDGVAITDATQTLTVVATTEETELLLFDLSAS